MKKIGLWALLMFIGVCCLGTAAQAVIPLEYVLVILPLPGGTDYNSGANAISGTDIAGYYNSDMPICWSGGKHTPLAVPVPFGSGKALGITTAIVGQALNATGRTRAFYWNYWYPDTPVQFLGYLPGLVDSIAYMWHGGMGFGVGYAYDHYTANSEQACTFKLDGTATALSPGKNSVAYAANNLKITGWETSDRTGGNQHAVLWDTPGGGSSWLDITPAASSAAALAITGDSVVTGYISTPTNHAFIWDAVKGMRINYDIGQAKGLAINDKYQVVGSSYASGSWPVAFIWEEGQGTVLLNSLAKNRGNFEIAEARGIDDNGWIVGWGYYPASQPVKRAFLLRPKSNVAEAITAIIMALLLAD